MTLYAGARVRLKWRVYDETVDPRVLADPDALSVLYGIDGATPVSDSWPGGGIERDSLGRFHLDIDCAEPGLWAADIDASGDVIAVGQERWTIKERAFEPGS